MGKTKAAGGRRNVGGAITEVKTAVPVLPAKAARDRRAPVDLGRALVEAFLTNERINQVLLDAIDPKIWRTMPPCSKRRNIATTFAHMHNVRCMRLTMLMRDEAVPAKLDRAEVTSAEAKSALAESAAAMVRLIERALAAGGHVPDFRPDVVALISSAITHDAHHRGQICHWARQLGSPLSPEQGLAMWEWDKRWKDAVVGLPGGETTTTGEAGRSMPVPQDVTELLDLYRPAVREIALAARALVLRAVPKVTEMVDRKDRLIGYGYGPGYKDAICTLILSQGGVKLGIVRGSELPDPAGLLEGSGKVHRHVPLKGASDVARPGILALLEAAMAAWKRRQRDA
jgi:uncharacterized damage-inducible protein DinB